MYVKTLGVSLAALLTTTAASVAYADDDPKGFGYFDFEQREQVFDSPLGPTEPQGPVTIGSLSPGQPGVVKSFEGISQYNVAAFGRNFIPPDTMGAIGKTQFMETTNGAYAVYDKVTGLQTALIKDTTFWANLGQPGANGDSRVMYNADANRWIALSFAASTSTIQIAVSDTSNALGGWKATQFVGIAGGIADYPTLAMDKNAVYIGTNDFNGAGTAFLGTTLNVIPVNSLFSASAPSTTGIKQFFTSIGAIIGGADPGYAIQGVNSSDPGSTGKIAAVSFQTSGIVRYDVLNAGTAGATLTSPTVVGAPYDANSAARQPATGTPGNARVVDTLDDRVGSSVWEVNGRIYTVHTITETGSDHTYVRYDIIDAVTNILLDEGDIGDGVHDYWEGSLAVNKYGQVVIGYDRSGSDPSDGKITFMARTFNTLSNGTLHQTGSELTLKVSLVDDYHNGSLDGQTAAGRQRWGDYSAVTVDPTDPSSFWAIGEFAREYNDAAGGHPGGTGGSRWGTFIAQISAGAVPEPTTWALMILGFGVTGLAARRRRAALAA